MNRKTNGKQERKEAVLRLKLSNKEASAREVLRKPPTIMVPYF
jgi:hypothetical protein